MSDEQKPTPQLMFMVRVKLPKSDAYHCSPSGDTEFENDRNAAIFAAKPHGFEIKYPRGGESWPVDSEGFTFVPLVMSSSKDALAYQIEQRQFAERRLKAISDAIKGISHLL